MQSTCRCNGNGACDVFQNSAIVLCLWREKELTGRKCLFPWNNNRKIKPRLQGQFTPNFFPLNRPSVTQAARGGTLIVHSWGAFGLLAPRWMVKPTIGSFKLFFFLNHHSHVLIKTNKKKHSFLSANVKSGIRSVSENVPRIMEKLAKTNTRGKSCHRLLNQVTALCCVRSPPLTLSLTSFSSTLSLSWSQNTTL